MRRIVTIAELFVLEPIPEIVESIYEVVVNVSELVKHVAQPFCLVALDESIEFSL
jgi:hypothetical protein